MKEHICILRNSNLINLVSINIVDGHRKRKNDVASCPARRKYGDHNTDIKSTYVLITAAPGR